MSFKFPVVSLGPPIITEKNNGILNSIKSMPFKDITSDGNSSFAMSRKDYVKTVQTTPTINTVLLHKKWFGNKDASQVTANRRINEIGNGSLNANNTNMSFKNVVDNNTQRQALTRVRNAGSAVPAKKIHKYANAPAIY
jgi:hypothetical protein